MSDFTDEHTDLVKGKPIFLGILGSRMDATQSKLIEQILNPMLQELGRPPDRMILPSEGMSSIYCSDWADSLRIPSQVYEADWHKHHRRAKIFRDARIQQESTHFLVFLNKRSEFNEKLALRLAKKGYPVFTVSYADWSLELLTSEVEGLSSIPQPVRQAKRGSKRGTGKGQELPQYPQSKDPGNQHSLPSLWGACTQKEAPMCLLQQEPQ
jgi:hypothetical protein